MLFIGKNNNELFIPAAGYYYDSYLVGDNHLANVWTSSLDLRQSDHASYLVVDCTGEAKVYSNMRSCGCTIHPVLY